MKLSLLEITNFETGKMVIPDTVIKNSLRLSPEDTSAMNMIFGNLVILQQYIMQHITGLTMHFDKIHSKDAIFTWLDMHSFS